MAIWKNKKSRTEELIKSIGKQKEDMAIDRDK